MGLVREHADGNPGGGKFVEEFGDSGKGDGRILPVAGVGGAVFEQHLLGLVALGGAVTGGEDVAHEIEHPVPNEGAVVVDRMNGEAARCEDRVTRVGKILESVEEGAVEIENNGFFNGGRIHKKGQDR